MKSPKDILAARGLLADAREFMREKGKNDPAVLPTLDFYTGALYALDWALEGRSHKEFGEHLASLQRVRRDMIVGEAS